MKLFATFMLALSAAACGHPRFRGDLPPLDPRCDTKRIAAADVEQVNRIAPATDIVSDSPYFFTGPRSGDGAYGFPQEMMNQPWKSPDSAYCLRLAVARSPHCPQNRSSLDCRNDWSWWQFSPGSINPTIRRIQADQKSCGLYGLYEDYLRFPHSEEEKAATCLRFIQYDPAMADCLEVNRAALIRLAKKKQQYKKQTYPTMLFKEFFGDYNTPLWEPEYDRVFAWLQSNLLPVMNPRRDPDSAAAYYRLSAVAAYRAKNRDALLQLIAQASRVKTEAGFHLNTGVEMYLLAWLGIRGDEPERLRRYDAPPLTEEMWAGVVRGLEITRKNHPTGDPFPITRCRL